MPGSGDRAAECAVATLPIDWFDPEGETFEALVKRSPATAPVRGQIWLLHGGPGASAVDDLYVLDWDVQQEHPDLEIYAVDHRGIGGSMRMGCPEIEAAGSPFDWDACIAAVEVDLGEVLPHITATASAIDVGVLARTLGGGDLFVYGGSYGTYLAQRYLHLFPDQPDGVILEGISHPGSGFFGYDADMDRVARDLFAVCSDDPSCAGRFDGDPWATAQAVVAALDDGHCPALGIDGDWARRFLASALFYGGLRDLVPALVHRLDRCNSDDVNVIVEAATQLGSILGGAPPPGNTGAGRSDALFFHVALSEMWYGVDDAPTVAQAEADWRTLTMSTGLETSLAAMREVWPAYPDPGFGGALAPYDGPLLMLQGGLDPATALAQAAPLADFYTAEDQTFVPSPTAPTT